MRHWTKVGLLVLLAGAGALWLAPEPGQGSPLIGESAPTLVLPDLSGREVSLASLRGKAVALNFWATWCPPCKEELPAFSGAWRASRGRCLEIVGITEESTREDAAAEVRRMEIPFPVVMDPEGAVARAYGVTGYPRTYVIDAEGKVRKIFTGMVSRERLEAALAPHVPASCTGL
jgi:cytochrome c biogenesis protein CcmG, thiol:disulfide interchange protein DsbE